MYNDLLQDAKKLHIVGIGGSGTYPLVQILHEKGYIITGSDNNPGDLIEKERELGAVVTIGHSADNVGDVDALVYSAAISDENPELIYARQVGIPIIPRAEVLRYLTKQYENAVCISGTHGKTSTTSMLTHVLVESGLDPTAVIGGKLPLINGYGRSGKSDIMVLEACEYKDTFLNLCPDIGIILNVAEDHMEYFKSLDNIIKSFRRFAELCSKVVIVNGDDKNALKAVEGIDTKVITFGLSSTNDYYADNIVSVSPIKTSFDMINSGKKIASLTISVPGEHHILNALSACISALNVGASVSDLEKYLPNFKGAGRRFETMGVVGGVTIVDDYAHHPTEILATLAAAKKMNFRKVWAVFQPFTYSRTKEFLEEFAQSLSIADYVVMSEIMGGRENNTYDIYTKDLAELIPNSKWFPKFPEIADYVMSNAQPNDLVITLGCGDIYKLAKMMTDYK